MAKVRSDTGILDKIKAYERGMIFFPEDFDDLGSAEAIRQTLHRLHKKGYLVRLAHGIYLYPNHDKELGILYPSAEEVAKAIARRDHARIVPTGIHALNKLGLSSQVPMNIIYLTDGAPRKVQIGKRSIKFKKTTPRNLMAKGEISSLVIQALRAIGKDNLTKEQRARIHELLQKEKPENITHDAKLAPAWIAKIMKDTHDNRK
ncbi:MAG: DUF6088 family protein [Bacteroidales bacterium]|jgi:hypothetical protein|nr:DUF6088 family protein [Bacteroidales bacterium]